MKNPDIFMILGMYCVSLYDEETEEIYICMLDKKGPQGEES